MANTAINHDPAATFPASSTDTAVVKWSGTGGKTLVNSGVLVDASNNITGLNNVTATGYLHLTGDEKELRFYEGSDYVAIKTNASLGASYTLTLPLNDGAANEFLQTNGSGVLTWAAAAGTTINSNADNRVITGSGTANTLEGEATLTFGSNALSFDNDHDGNNAINLINDSNTASASTRLTIQTAGASAGDAVALFHAGGDSYIIGVDNSDSNKFKIAATGGNLGTNDRVALTSDGYFDLYKSGGGSTTNGHVTISHSGVGHGLTTLPATDHINSAQAVTASTYFAIQPGWYATGGGTAVKSFSEGNTGFYLTSWVAGAWTTQATNQGGSCQVMTRFHDGSNGNATINSAANLFTVGYYDGTTMARRFHFTAAGDGYADSSWTTFSDNRLKFNQEVLPYGLDTLMQLQPKVYDKYSGAIKDGVVTLEDSSARREIGFIAQEIKALVPEIVTPNADENNGWYALDDGKLMAVVVKAIQELKAEIDELKG